MALSTDQRWLLLHMGSWQIVHALCSPDGTRGLMNSRWGSTGGGALPPDAPEWLNGCGWETEASTIAPRWLGGRPAAAPTFTIKPAAINRYAEQLPEEIKAELLDCRNAGTANAVLKYRFCRCGSKKCGYGYLKDRICPPTPEQEKAADEEYWRIVEWQGTVLRRALALDGQSEGNQLQLFEAVS
jgi:hypothetical protein